MNYIAPIHKGLINKVMAQKQISKFPVRQSLINQATAQKQVERIRNINRINLFKKQFTIAQTKINSQKKKNPLFPQLDWKVLKPSTSDSWFENLVQKAKIQATPSKGNFWLKGMIETMKQKAFAQKQSQNIAQKTAESIRASEPVVATVNDALKNASLSEMQSVYAQGLTTIGANKQIPDDGTGEQPESIEASMPGKINPLYLIGSIGVIALLTLFKKKK
jgi:hypothetical protein